MNPDSPEFRPTDDVQEKKRVRQQKIVEEVLPNLPHDIMAVREESEAFPGTEITADMLELSELLRFFEKRFHGEAGHATDTSVFDVPKEEVDKKMERVKELMSQRIERDQKFMASIEELHSKSSE